MPATRPDALPPIDVGAWLRVGSKFQGSNSKKLNDFSMDSAYVELHAGGKIHKNVGVTLNLNANMLDFDALTGKTGPGAAVAIEDAIISFDFMDEFHLWAGHLLVPVDRANSAGPFFMIGWNYPGMAPVREGPYGRNNGAVVWGDISGGKLTYLVGVFDNGTALDKTNATTMTTIKGSSPLFSGRLRLSLLDPEGGFWGNASYFGEKDIFSIALGGQYQKKGEMETKDYTEVNADVLFEKKLPGGAWVTGEGAYYFFNTTDGNLNNVYYLLAAYATPTMGVGNIQPMLRWQAATYKGGGTGPKNLDAALAYLIKGPALRVIATYSYGKSGDLTSNSIQLGAQAIFF